MVIGEYVIVGRRRKIGDGHFTFKWTFDVHADEAAAYKAAAALIQGLRSERLVVRESCKQRALMEHPDYVRRWVEGVRSGRKDDAELYSVFTRMVTGLDPLARVMA